MGIEQPRDRCGSVFTWNTESTCRGFTVCRKVTSGVCWNWFILARFHLSLRGRVSMTVVVASSLVLFLRCPHSRVCLGGAIGQRRVNRVIFPHGGSLVVFRLITLGENKCLILWTWKVIKEIRVQGCFSINESDVAPAEERTYWSCCPWSWIQMQGWMGRTQMCFSVSSSIPFPPDLDSACDSLSHSLRNRHGWNVWTNRHVRLQITVYGIFSYPYSGSPVWSLPTATNTNVVHVILLYAAADLFKNGRSLTKPPQV